MANEFGPPSALTCSDCGGALWEVEDGRVLRYQCHVGHQYAPDVLENEQRDAVDGALWNAVRVLEEHADLKGRLAGARQDAPCSRRQSRPSKDAQFSRVREEGTDATVHGCQLARQPHHGLDGDGRAETPGRNHKDGLANCSQRHPLPGLASNCLSPSRV
jgi:hypothetical protein